MRNWPSLLHTFHRYKRTYIDIHTHTYVYYTVYIVYLCTNFRKWCVALGFDTLDTFELQIKQKEYYGRAILLWRHAQVIIGTWLHNC